MSNINLGQAMRSLTLGRPLDEYTGVLIRVGRNSNGDDVVFAAGDDTGYVLEIDNPIGTQAMAYAILAGLQLRGARFRPYEAEKAILDPAAEIGDGVTVNGTDSLILSIHAKHSRLMPADISAPYNEEVNHEFQFVPKTQREIRREVIRATDAEAALGSRITINETQITAKVSRTGGSPSSFGWELTDSEWKLISNNNTVLTANASGVAVSGTITATAGVIGGVRIENGTLSGITDTNIAQGGISGGTSGSIRAATITTHNTVSGINTNLGYAANWGSAKSGYGSAEDVYATHFHSSGTSYLSSLSTYYLIHYPSGNEYRPISFTVNGTTYHVFGYTG